MLEKYISILNALEFEDSTFLGFKKALLRHDHSLTAEESFAWIACVLALNAASLGNLGVGAILVENDRVIVDACNEMFNPYYRSDGHPEMMVLTEFEFHHRRRMNSITMYSSLEPCPMCLTRLTTTGIGEVKYIAAHPESGMSRSIEKLPLHWRQYGEDLNIRESACSIALKTLSRDLLNETVRRLMPSILSRKGKS
jgi:cytosine deaminase